MNTIYRILTVAWTLALSAGPALAEEAEGPKEAIPWAAWGISIVFLIAVGLLAFKNARRTHLD